MTAKESLDTTVVSAAPAEYPLTETQIEAIGRELGEPGWLVDRRLEALRRYRSLPWPLPSDEAWKRSAILHQPLQEFPLMVLGGEGKPKKMPAERRNWIKESDTAARLIFEDGRLVTGNNPTKSASAELICTSMQLAARDHPEQVKRWAGEGIPHTEEKIAALADAVWDAGAFVFAPEGLKVEQPVVISLWDSGSGFRAWRTVIVAEPGSELTVWLDMASGTGSDLGARLGIIEIVVREGAHVRFMEMQDWGNNVIQINHERCMVEQSGRLDWRFLHQGGRFSKTFARLDLCGEDSAGDWAGIGVFHGGQEQDYESLQNHLAGRTTSTFQYKTAVGAGARSVWRGMVRMDRKAMQSDGYQANRNLVLSPDARTESIPGLEILADDVRCSHGVTVGGPDPEAMFYLQTRGIPPAEAERALIRGFFGPIVDSVGGEPLRRRMHAAIDLKLDALSVPAAGKTE